MRTQELDHQKIWKLCPDWDALTDEEKCYIDPHVEVVYYDRNEIIHHEGDTPTHMMMLVQGKVRIYKEGIGQKQQIIRMLKPYEFFGYRAIVAGETYNVTASALEPCIIYKLPSSVFLNILRRNNQICFLMMEWMARDVATAQRQTVNLTQKHIRGRLAEAVVRLIEQYGLDDDGATINMYISREDIANISSMTTSNAIRTLSQFAQEGIISIDGKKIKVLDYPELEHVSRIG